MKTVIEVVTQLLQRLANTEEKLYVRIVTRNAEGVVVGAKLAPITYIQTVCQETNRESSTRYSEAICIEESEIQEVNPDFNLPFSI